MGAASPVRCAISASASTLQACPQTCTPTTPLVRGVIIASTRGGIYSTSEMGQAAEHQESYLKVMLGFFGITDVRFVRAEGMGLGPEAKASALEGAAQQVRVAVTTDKAANQESLAQAA